MRTLISDDEPERPSNNATYIPAAGSTIINTAGTATVSSANLNLIVTTGGYVAGDPPPPEPYRTKAWVEKPKAIEAGEA